MVACRSDLSYLWDSHGATKQRPLGPGSLLSTNMGFLSVSSQDKSMFPSFSTILFASTDWLQFTTCGSSPFIMCSCFCVPFYLAEGCKSFH